VLIVTPDKATRSTQAGAIATPRPASTKATTLGHWVASCTTWGRSGGIAKYQKNIHTSSGTFRKNST